MSVDELEQSGSVTGKVDGISDLPSHIAILGGSKTMFDLDDANLRIPLDDQTEQDIGTEVGNLDPAWDPLTPKSQTNLPSVSDASPAPTASTESSGLDALSPQLSSYNNFPTGFGGNQGFFGFPNIGLSVPELSQLPTSPVADVSVLSATSPQNLYLSPLSRPSGSITTPINSATSPESSSNGSSELWALTTPRKLPGQILKKKKNPSPKFRKTSAGLFSPASSPECEIQGDTSSPPNTKDSPLAELVDHSFCDEAGAPSGRQRKRKKQKIKHGEAEDEEVYDEEDGDEDGGEDISDDVDADANSSTTGRRKPKKTAHNVIEKRYRTNLNQKFALLRDSVPSLRVTTRGRRGKAQLDSDIKRGKLRGYEEDLDGLTPAHKLNKATVLSKAVEYILHLESRNKKLTDDLEVLKSRVDDLERRPVSVPAGLDSFPEWTPGELCPEDNAPTSVMPSTGMIPMSEEMQRLRRRGRTGVPLSPAAEETSMSRAKKQSQLASRFILGSLAGLVVLEGTGGDNSGHQGHGMGALPWLEGLTYSRLGFSVSEVLHMIRVLLAFAAFSAMIYPILFSLKSKRRRSSRPEKVLEKDRIVSSVAKHHQKAFLAAAQTLRFPSAGVLPESLSILSEIGNALLGSQSFGRRKTWDMAVDSQMLGGDPHVSTGRVVLGIVGGLSGMGAVSSSVRYVRHLMRLSLQLRIACAGSMDGPGRLASMWVWRRAQKVWTAEHHSDTASTSSGSDHDSGGELSGGQPNHIFSLLSLDYDTVFSPVVVGRATRMVWSHSLGTLGSALSSQLGQSIRAEASIGVTAWLDEALHDEAIMSPLDLLAAWVSAMELHFALMGFLSIAVGFPAGEEMVNGEGDEAVDSSTSILSQLPSQSALALSTDRATTISETAELSDDLLDSSPEQPVPSVDEKVILSSLDTALRVAPPGSAIHLRVLAARGVVDSEGEERLHQLRDVLQARTVTRGRAEGPKIPTDVLLGMELGECVIEAESEVVSRSIEEVVEGETSETALLTPKSVELAPSVLDSIKSDAAVSSPLSFSSAFPLDPSVSSICSSPHSSSSSSVSSLMPSSSPSSLAPPSLPQRLSSLAVLFSSPSITAKHSLLSLAAAHTALHSLLSDRTTRTECQAGLERLASGIRDIVGRRTASSDSPSFPAPFCRSIGGGTPGLAGLSDRLRARLVDDCLAVTRVLVGLDEDGDETCAEGLGIK